MIKKLTLAGLLLLHAAIWLQAQTKADSVAIVSAQWETSSPREGVTLKCAAIGHLYGGPQYISIVEVEPRKALRAGIALSAPPAPTSAMAQAHKAVAAINGSYFNMKKGNSVCFLQLDGEVIDTTTTAELNLRVNGAVQIKKGRLRILPWSKKIEESYHGKNDVLASGPMLLQRGNISNWEACDSSFVHTKHPRSAVVVEKDGTTWFVTVDGRAPGHANGMSIPEPEEARPRCGWRGTSSTTPATTDSSTTPANGLCPTYSTLPPKAAEASFFQAARTTNKGLIVLRRLPAMQRRLAASLPIRHGAIPGASGKGCSVPEPCAAPAVPACRNRGGC